MDFARKQLEKYGWSDGKGLGKTEDGISEPLKPRLKRSVAGLGHDAATDFTEHWWNTLYDKAAGNIEVEEKNGKTKKIKAKEEFEITNSEWKLKRKKTDKPAPVEEQYTDFFVKKAILTNVGSKTEIVNNDSEDEIVEKDVIKMTDEELFAACGGRTAHKGARHGLKALGKLARIEEQEKQLLNQDRFQGYSHKKKRKDSCIKEDRYTENPEKIIEDTLTENIEERKRSKKKKKKYCKDNKNFDNHKQEKNNDDLDEAANHDLEKEFKKSKKHKRNLESVKEEHSRELVKKKKPKKI